jgi:hypothetical protein
MEYIYNIHDILTIKINVPQIIPEFFAYQDNKPLNTNSLSIFMVRIPSLQARPKSMIYIYKDTIIYRFGVFIVSDIFDRVLKNVFLDKGYYINNMIIPYYLLQKGYLMVHSECVSHSDRGILICAYPDTGKTYTCLHLCMNREFEFLSDDLTIVRGKEAYCYPKLLTLKYHHFNRHGSQLGRYLLQRLPRHINFTIKLKNIRKIIYPKSQVEVRVDPRYIFPTIKNQTSIEEIYILKRSDSVKDAVLLKLDKSVAYDYIVKITESEIPYSYFLGRFHAHELLTMRDKLIKDMLDKVDKVFLLESSDYRYFPKIIKENFYR